MQGPSLVARTDPLSSLCCPLWLPLFPLATCCSSRVVPHQFGVSTGLVSSEHKLCPPCAWCQAASGCVGRARSQLCWGCKHRQGQPGRQMDSSSASILHPFSPRQTLSDFHKSKRHTV